MASNYYAEIIIFFSQVISKPFFVNDSIGKGEWKFVKFTANINQAVWKYYFTPSHAEYNIFTSFAKRREIGILL